MELQYKDYYLRTISQHESGIKLVLGGTGLGKTHGMREAVTEYLNEEREIKKKFIYITNRHNLITEQQKKFGKTGLKCCYLKSNRDIILDLLESHSFWDMISEFEKLNYFKYDTITKSKYQRENKLKKIVEGIEHKAKLLAQEKQKKSTLVKPIDDDLQNECNELFNYFKNQLVLLARNKDELHEKLKQNKFVWNLFPYVEFENNPEANILLVTIHKVLKGFFDGKKDLKIASLEKKIIILDEFDFLEQDIIKFLCDEPSIINPLEFVRIFYEKFKHWSKANFWEGSETLKEVREKFNGVINYLETKTKEKGLSFPSVIDFRLEKAPEENAKPFMLFQTNEIITTRKFFLKERDDSWYIQEEKSKDTVSPFELFNILAIATNKILGVFHFYQFDPNLVSEIIQAIWNQKNDNIGGRYEDYINENCLYHRTTKQSGRAPEPYKDKSPYEIGFRLVKLAKRTNSFDPTSAELGQIELFTSPEEVIAKLADNNLVFALSATTDIPRTLKCFNIEWLKENSTFIPLDETDYEIIEARRNIKREQRQTKVNLRIAGTFDETHSVGAAIKSMLTDNYFTPGTESETVGRNRYDRIMKVFDTLYKCVEGDKFSHLVFLTTFKEFRDIIDYEVNANKIYFQDCNKNVFSCRRFKGSHYSFFQMTLNGKDCSVLLLDAKEARELQDNDAALNFYKDCFKGANKVFVITQYKSASNGINLPCYQSFGDHEFDFEGIHLLEPQHFWFDDSDELDKLWNIEKQAYWYLWKLKDSLQIDGSQFTSCLGAREAKRQYKIDISKFNTLYKDKVDEKIANAISLFHQALGRIERRDEKVEQVDVTLDKDVFQDFFLFLSGESFKDLVASRERITSSLILSIHEAVLAEAKRINFQIELSANKSFADRNNHSRNIIRELLEEISKVREGKLDENVSNEVKGAWTGIRESLLQHDFEKRIHLEVIGRTIQFKKDFAFETKLINKNKELHIDLKQQKVYSEKAPVKKLSTWNLDLAYRTISKNGFLKHHFEKSNYKTAFDIKPNLVNPILTPYIYQALLLGAIGEEAISFLLSQKGISLDSFAEMDNSLFEIVDAKMKDRPIYFDFKNYGQNTLEKFSLSSGDLNYDEEVNNDLFIEKLKFKYEALKKHHETPVLYILNLYSDQRRSPNYLDENLKQVDYEKDSCIRIIPSVLNHANPEMFSADFEATLNLLKIHEAETV